MLTRYNFLIETINYNIIDILKTLTRIEKSKFENESWKLCLLMISASFSWLVAVAGFIFGSDAEEYSNSLRSGKIPAISIQNVILSWIRKCLSC